MPPLPRDAGKRLKRLKRHESSRPAAQQRRIKFVIQRSAAAQRRLAGLSLTVARGGQQQPYYSIVLPRSAALQALGAALGALRCRRVLIGFSLFACRLVSLASASPASAAWAGLACAGEVTEVGLCRSAVATWLQSRRQSHRPGCTDSPHFGAKRDGKGFAAKARQGAPRGRCGGAAFSRCPAGLTGAPSPRAWRSGRSSKSAVPLTQFPKTREKAA